MMKLYQLYRCPYCVKVRDKLDELMLNYEVINVGKTNRPEIVMSLGGGVPVIVDGDVKMAESSDIVEYLEKKYGKGEAKKEDAPKFCPIK